MDYIDKTATHASKDCRLYPGSGYRNRFLKNSSTGYAYSVLWVEGTCPVGSRKKTLLLQLQFHMCPCTIFKVVLQRSLFIHSVLRGSFQLDHFPILFITQLQKLLFQHNTGGGSRCQLMGKQP